MERNYYLLDTFIFFYTIFWRHHYTEIYLFDIIYHIDKGGIPYGKSLSKYRCGSRWL